MRTGEDVDMGREVSARSQKKKKRRDPRSRGDFSRRVVAKTGGGVDDRSPVRDTGSLQGRTRSPPLP